MIYKFKIFLSPHLGNRNFVLKLLFKFLIWDIIDEINIKRFIENQELIYLYCSLILVILNINRDIKGETWNVDQFV